MFHGQCHVELFFFDAGGGHRSAATALQLAMARQYPQWHVSLVNLQDVLHTIDPVSKISKFQTQDVYNGFLKRGWTYGSSAMLRGMQHAIKLLAPLAEEKLRAHWAVSQPDVVVSLIPNFNAILFNALRAVHPHVPYGTVMTDLADCPPHFWQEKQDQFVVCGTNKAMQQAQAMGYAAEKIFRVSGMVLNPQFYEPVTEPLQRSALGLDDTLPTALVMFGGYGSNKAAAVVKQLAACKQPVQSIVLCGHNQKLLKKLQHVPHCHAVGFTKNVPAYMQTADFFIGKPGPGSISEALHMGLPVIVEHNARTMLQERYNAQWVDEQGVGAAVKTMKNLPAVVDRLLVPATWAQHQQAIAALNNRAVFEVPAIIERVMGGV